MKHAGIFVAALVFALVATTAAADESAIYGSYTHVMGLYDTKGDARVLCYSGLVKSLSQRVAATLARTPEVVSAGISRKELEANLPFLLRVELMGESFSVHGDDLAFSMNGRAAVDPAAIASAVSRARTDQAYAEEIKAGLERFARLERDVRNRQAKIAAEIAGVALPSVAVAAAAPSPAPQAPAPAAAVQALPAAPEAAVQAAETAPAAALPPAPPAPALQAQAEIPAVTPPEVPPAPKAGDAAPMVFAAAQAPEALFSLRSGMSYKEMLETVGAPAQRSECGNKVFYNYANVWVYFSDGQLVGYLLMDNWKGPCHPYVGFMGEILYF